MIALKRLREEKNMTQEELGKALSVHKRTVSNWEQGFRNPNSTQRKKICKYFGITEAELYQPGSPQLRETSLGMPALPRVKKESAAIRVPLIGSIPSDRIPLIFDSSDDTNVREWLEITTKLVKEEDKAVALEIKNDCLEGECIRPGDIIFVSNKVGGFDPDDSGEIHVVRVKNKYNCKRVFKFGKQPNLVLQKVHSRYPEAFSMDPKELESEIIGRVIAVIRKL